MRRVLVDYARAHKADRRTPEAPNVVFDEEVFSSRPYDCEHFLELEECFQKLAEFDPRGSRIAEMRLFSGLKNSEIADLLDVSVPTVKRDWLAARLFLAKCLGPPGQSSDSGEL